MKIWLAIFCAVAIMSVKKCCVPNCNKTRSDNNILHCFPNPDKDVDRFEMWKNTIGGTVTSLDRHTIFKLRRVCHLHFVEKYHTRSKRLSASAVPTMHLPEFKQFTQQDSDMIDDHRHQQHSEVNRASTSAWNPQQSFVQPSTSSAHKIQKKKKNQNAPTPTTSSEIKRPLKSYSSEINHLGKTIKLLRKAKDSTMAKLKKALKLSENRTFQTALKKFTTAATIFTLLQFREIGKHKLGRRFKQEEKIMALTMFKQVPRAHRWLRKFFVLPSPLTLTRMISKASIRPGINDNLFTQLKKKVDKMTKLEKLCVLLFDEVALTPHFDYNRRSDSISGFVNYDGKNNVLKIADHALVFMLRGLHKNYKQPIAYCFCGGTIPKNELAVQIRTIIQKLHSIGLIVIATICDQGSTNVAALNYLVHETQEKHLRKNVEKKHFTYNIENSEIIPLYDPPRLMKGIRNNLLTKNLKCTLNGVEKTGKWDHILKLYEQNPAYEGIRLMPKLTERHVIPNKISKMKVKCATQVFSQTVAANMGYLASQGILPLECCDTADILLFFDKLFDSFNGSFNRKMRKPLLCAVTPNSAHKTFWSEAMRVLKTMKFVKNNNVLGSVPSISHWIQTVENVIYMLKKLSQEYDLTSVWMRHLNQNPLENFFGCIRSHGCRNTSPSCAGFKSAFASLLVNNLSSVHSPGSNCQKDSCTMFKPLKNIFFGEPVKSNHTVEIYYEDLTNFEFVDVKKKLQNAKIRAQLEYVSGYVLRKLKQKVFKRCDICKECFYSKKNEDSSLLAREYFSEKECLTYPHINIIKSFSNMQDVIIYIIRKDASRQSIKLYIRTIFSVLMDYSYVKCEEHKYDVINKLEDLTVNLFLFSWCKDTNKLINGSRGDYDELDKVQAMAVNYCRKRYHE